MQLMVVEAKTHNFERLFDFNSNYFTGVVELSIRVCKGPTTSKEPVGPRVE